MLKAIAIPWPCRLAASLVKRKSVARSKGVVELTATVTLGEPPVPVTGVDCAVFKYVLTLVRPDPPEELEIYPIGPVRAIASPVTLAIAILAQEPDAARNCPEAADPEGGARTKP